MSPAKRVPVHIAVVAGCLALFALSARAEPVVVSVDQVATPAETVPAIPTTVPAKTSAADVPAPTAEATRPITTAAIVPVVPTAAITPPSDPVKRAAFDMLDTHCSRCHQSGKLVDRAKPAKNLGNILNLDEMAKNKKLVLPGDPDGSLLYHLVVVKEMPKDVFQDFELDHPVPGNAEIAALRTWIESLDPAAPKTVFMAKADPNARLPIENKAIDVHIEKDKKADESAKLEDDAGNPALTPEQVLITEAQDRLIKLGCFTGDATGVEDSQTQKAITRYNTKLGRVGAGTSVTASLVDELDAQQHEVCEAVCPKGQVADGPRCVPEGAGPAATVAKAPVSESPIRRRVRQEIAKPERDESPKHAAKPEHETPAKHPVREAHNQAPPPRQAPKHETPRAAPRVVLRQPPRPQRAAPVIRQAGGGSGHSAPSGDTISGLNGI